MITKPEMTPTEIAKLLDGPQQQRVRDAMWQRRLEKSRAARPSQVVHLQKPDDL